MSFVQQEQLGSGKRFVEMFSHPWIQKGITRSKDDADGPIKGLEDRQALCIRLQRCLQVTRQGDESREGARCVCKLVQNYWQQCSLLRSPRAELFPLPSEEPLGHIRFLSHSSGQGCMGRVGKESNELGEAQGWCIGIV